MVAKEDVGGVHKWAAGQLSALLQMPAEDCDEIVEHVLSFTDPDELKDFLSAFAVGNAGYKVAKFAEELFDRRNKGKTPPKQDIPDQSRSASKAEGKGNKGKDVKQAGNSQGRGNSTKNKDPDNFPILTMPMLPKDKADKRLVVIDAASGRHKELTNCLNCGKVIVEEEGWGPCLFCGNPLEVGDRFGLRHGDDRGFLDPVVGQGKMDETKYNESFQNAVATKDRLLSYDKDAKKRTKVYDDATDFYSESVNPWLSEKQREEAMRNAKEEEHRKREERRKIHATIDFFGRTVVSADAEVRNEQDKKARENFQAWTEKTTETNKLLTFAQEQQRGMGGANSHLSDDSKQLYEKLRASLHAAGRDMDGSAWKDKTQKDGNNNKKKDARWESTDKARVEDEFIGVSMKDFNRAHMSRLLPVEESPYTDEDDGGHCLSMHQPWASLLVYGFKRAEGRAWKTDHRGRLWIHAAGKPPEKDDIEQLEVSYRSLYEANGVPIPPLPSETGGYPTSALLGCVDLEECFQNQTYMEMLNSNPSLPKEENDNEYIFWCLRPRRLVVPVKMGGNNKIWRLPQGSLRPMQAGLQPVRWPAPDDAVATGMRGSTVTASSVASTKAASSTAPGAQTSAPAKHDEAAAIGTRISGDAATQSGDKVTVSNTPLAKNQASPKDEAMTAGGKSSSSASSGVTANGAAGRSGSGGGGGSRAPPRLDIWPAQAPSEVLEVVERDKDMVDRDVVVLQNGFVQLIGFIPQDLQQRVVDELRELGVAEHGLVAEQFDGIKVTNAGARMYLGMRWNVNAQRWDTIHTDDNAPVNAIPKFFLDMYQDAVQRANRELTRAPNKKRKLVPFPEGKPPTLAVTNFLHPNGTMQAHQDKTESKASIDAGYPVMGICIGDSCDFVYGSEPINASRKPKSLRLASGDVYLFGGESRLMWHGVSKILPRSGPPSLRLLPGRLSVTLRVH